MSRHVFARLVWATLLVQSLPSQAGPLSVDLPTALARANDRSPAGVASLGEIGEAEAARVGARVRYTQNPEFEAGAGPRFGDRSIEAEARLGQTLTSRRAERIGLADAGLRRAHAVRDVRIRELGLEVTLVFYEALHADRVVDLARRTEDLAVRAFDTTDRRRKAGDITDLDVDLAKVALGRARSAVAASRAERADAIGRLAVLIGARPEDDITLRGDLRPGALELASLRAAAPARADVRAFEADGNVAAAERELAAANARPEIGVWLGYSRDTGDNILLGGLRFTLPVFNRAQGDAAIAAAHARRATAQRATVIVAASRQIEDAFEAYTRSKEAVETFERDVLPALDDGEKLLGRSVETGQIAIGQFLVARQEILSGRREYLDRLLALANAVAETRFVAGVSP